MNSAAFKMQSTELNELADKPAEPFPASDNRPSSSGSLELVDLASHKTMEEALPFTVEWQGTNYRVFVPRSVLEDLDQAPSYRQDQQLVESFRRNEKTILKRTLAVLENGRGRWGTVLLKAYDFPELFQ